MNVFYPRLLDGNLNVLRRIEPVRGSLDMELEPLSSAELELQPGDSIPERSWVAVFTAYGLAGIFRSKPQRDRYGERSTTVSLVHGATELNDFLTGKTDEDVQSAANTAIQTIFASYHGSLWTLGTVSPTASVVYGLNNSGVLDALVDLMEQLPGYMITFDQTVTPWEVNIVPRPAEVTAEGRLSRNIQSVEITRDDSSLCTKVYYGENNSYVQDATAAQKYGVIEHRISESGYTDVQLLTMAQAYLDSHKAPKLSVSISAIDLSQITGEPLDQIALGSKYRLVIPDAETEENRVIEQIVCSVRYDDFLTNPNPQITLASDPESIITFLKQQRRSGGAGRAVKQLEEKVNNQYQHWTTENEVYKESVYKILGVELNPDGTVKYQYEYETDPVTGEPIIDPETGEPVIKVDPETGEPVIATDSAGNPIPVYNPDSEGSLGGSVKQTAQDLTSLYTKTGVASLPAGVTNLFSYTSSIKQTAESIQTEVTAARGTSSSLGDRVSTLSSQISQQADKISLVVTSTTQDGQTTNSINTAGIILAINGGKQGDSSATIQADKIYMDAAKTVTLGDVLFIQTGGNFWVKRSATFGSTAGSLVTINGGTVNAPTLQVNSGGILKFAGSSQSESALQISRATMAGLITDIQVAAPTEGSTSYTVQYKKIGTGDTWQTAQVPIPGGGGGGSGSSGITDAIVTNGVLTLTKADGTSVTFKKATSLSGVWSSGTYTVTAKQINYNTITQEDEEVTVGTDSTEIYGVDIHGTITRQSTPKFLNVPVRVLYTDSQEQSGFSPTGFTDTIGVDASLIFEDGETAGKGAVNLKTFNNQKKATWIDDDDPLHPATYYISTDGKGTGNEDEAWIDPSDAIDYGKTLVSVTRTWNEYAETPTSPTTLSSGKTYNLVVQKDGTDVYNEFYTVPSAISPKISRDGTWSSGSQKFIAGTTGSDDITVKIKSDTQSGTLIYGDQQEPTKPTAITFDVYEDTGNNTKADTGADITATIARNSATLSLGTFDSTNSKFTVSKSSSGTVSVGGSSIQVGITPLDILVTKGTATPNTPQWDSTNHKYAITADGSFQVGVTGNLTTIPQTQGSIEGGFTPTDAINYGKSLSRGISNLTLQQTTETAYNNAINIPELGDIVGNGYYYVTAIPVDGTSVVKKFHAPSGGSGSSSRTATYLEPITLTAPQNPEQDFDWTFDVGSIAHYENPLSVGTENTQVSIDASAIYQAGIAAATVTGTVDVNKSNWTTVNNTANCFFLPSKGTGQGSSVSIRQAPIEGTASHGEVDILDGDEIISKAYFVLMYDSQRQTVTLRHTLSANYIIPRGTDIAVKSVSGGGEESSEEYAVTSIDNITLTESDISTVTKYPVLHYNDPNQSTDNTVPLQIDASAVYTKGLNDASRLNIEELRTITQPLTQNKEYTFKPSDYQDAMRAIKFSVNVPPVYRRAESLAQTIVLPSNHTGIKTVTGNTVEYDEGPDTGNFSVVIDASNVWQAGFNEGAGAEFTATKVNVQGAGPYSATIVSGNGVSFNKYGYDKLYYYDDEREKYVACVDRARYWFYTTTNASGGAYYQGSSSLSYYKKGYEATYYVRTE